LNRHSGSKACEPILESLLGEAPRTPTYEVPRELSEALPTGWILKAA
jgi:hypothetical protein